MKLISLILSAGLSASLVTACASVPTGSHAKAIDHPEAKPFDTDPSLVAQLAVDDALANAATTGKHAMIVMGGNIDVAQRFGLENIVGTPTVVVTNAEGEVLNLDTAVTWRHSASLTEDFIFEAFETLAQQ